MPRETVALILAIVALFLSGIGIGLSIWNMVVAIKRLFDCKNSSDGCDGSGEKR